MLLKRNLNFLAIRLNLGGRIAFKAVTSRAGRREGEVTAICVRRVFS